MRAQKIEKVEEENEGLNTKLERYKDEEKKGKRSKKFEKGKRKKQRGIRVNRTWQYDVIGFKFRFVLSRILVFFLFQIFYRSGGRQKMMVSDG